MNRVRLHKNRAAFSARKPDCGPLRSSVTAGCSLNAAAADADLPELAQANQFLDKD
jgi:hypothetical protein